MKDTDTDWAMLGEGEPFFGVLSEPRFLRANITPEALEDFWATGRNEMNGYRQLIQTHFGAFPDASALDFGCGVGRLTRAMGEMCQKATGLDISPGMLAEARRHAPSNVSYVSELGDETFDWLNSIIVFQHIPPKRGYRLLDDLLARVNPGGALSLHITLFKDESFLTHIWPALRRGQWDVNAGVFFVNLDHPDGVRLCQEWKSASLEKWHYIADRPDFPIGGPDDQSILHEILASEIIPRSSVRLTSKAQVNSQNAAFIRQHLRGDQASFERRAAFVRRASHHVLASYYSLPESRDETIAAVVEGLYLGLLGRPADPVGAQAYHDVIMSSGPRDGVNVVADSMSRSQEFVSRRAAEGT